MHAAQCCFADHMPLLVENLPGYLDIFACGMLSRMAVRTLWPPSAHAAHLARHAAARASRAWLLCALLIHMFDHRMDPQWQTALQIYTRPLYGLSFAAIAIGSLAAPRAWQALLANPPLRFLAIISYNLYLYHQTGRSRDGQQRTSRHI